MKCRNEHNHTPEPKTYPEWFGWAAEMHKTHEQTRCPECRKFVIWTPRGRRLSGRGMAEEERA